MKIVAALCAGALALTATTAEATDFSFVGNLTGPNQVLLFNFSVGSASTVGLRSYSYAGGTNAQGAVIARGGFDPILSLYNSAGTRIGQQDDGSDVPPDIITGRLFDVNFSQLLSAGAYTVAVSAYSNFCGATLAVGCGGGGSFTDVTGNVRDAHFAFDVLNVASATGPGGGGPVGAVPEPASWALMILGMGAVGFAVRRRKVSTRVSFA